MICSVATVLLRGVRAALWQSLCNVLLHGIGGFRSGLEQAGGFECVGFCEIDKYAAAVYRAIYNTEGEVYYDDVARIDTAEMPDFDLFTGGFPCQSFSVSGAGRGFDDPRGALFFELARIIREKRPATFLLENVPRLISHDKYRTFQTVLSTLSELGYCVEWMVLNSAAFGLAQSRNRVYIVGHRRPERAGRIFPVECGDYETPVEIIGGPQGSRVYSAEGTAVSFIDKKGIRRIGVFRKLMPLESWRLQGFKDEQFNKVKALGISDTRLYKMAGNAVSVPVIKAIGEKIRDVIFDGGR